MWNACRTYVAATSHSQVPATLSMLNRNSFSPPTAQVLDIIWEEALSPSARDPLLALNPHALVFQPLGSLSPLILSGGWSPLSVLPPLPHFEVTSSSHRSATAAFPPVEVRGSSLPRGDPILSELGDLEFRSQSVGTPLSNTGVGGSSSPPVTTTLSRVEVLGSSSLPVATSLSHIEVKGSSLCQVTPTADALKVQGSSPCLVAHSPPKLKCPVRVPHQSRPTGQPG